MSALTKPDLCRLIPHDGAMCLLDTVEQWDDARITCRTGSHRDQTNPLRRGDRLEGICGLEYAAQAMAVHVGILNQRQSDQAVVGYLGAVRDLTLRVQRLDEVQTDLTVEARRVLAHSASFIYTFRLSAEGRELMSGRASIFLKHLDS